MDDLPKSAPVVVDSSPLKKERPQKTAVLIALLVFALIIILAGGTYWYLIGSKKGETAQSAKWCSGVKIVFFAGGNQDDSFASVVYNGAKEAQSDLGPDVEYVWSNWDSNKMVTQFINAIAENPDAIAVMGHPGSAALGPLVDEAERKNIIITSQNVDITDIRTKYIAQGFGYVGQQLYDAGLTVSDGVLRKYQLDKGTEAVVFGVASSDPARYQRTKGIIDGLTKGGLAVHEVTIPVAVQADTTTPQAEKMVSDALAKYPKTKVIISDHGALTSEMPAHLKDLGKNPGEIISAGFDLSPATVAGIKNGYIGLILDQQPYLQGYFPILQACLTKKYKFSGLNIDTGVGLIDSSNVDVVAALADKKIR